MENQPETTLILGYEMNMKPLEDTPGKWGVFVEGVQTVTIDEYTFTRLSSGSFYTKILEVVKCRSNETDLVVGIKLGEILPGEGKSIADYPEELPESLENLKAMVGAPPRLILCPNWTRDDIP